MTSSPHPITSIVLTSRDQNDEWIGDSLKRIVVAPRMLLAGRCALKMRRFGVRAPIRLPEVATHVWNGRNGRSHSVATGPHALISQGGSRSPSATSNGRLRSRAMLGPRHHQKKESETRIRAETDEEFNAATIHRLVLETTCGAFQSIR